MDTNQASESKPLTTCQIKVRDCIVNFWRENNYAPTLQEISNRIGIYPNAVEGHVLALQKKGWVTKTPKVSRSIVPTEIARHMEKLSNEESHPE
jgi:SOS-response transcriptional repressor LexA